MRTFKLSVDVDGAGDGVARRGVPHGHLRGIQVDYTGQPAGTDLTLQCVFAGITKTILTLANNNTDMPLQTVKELALDEVGAQIVDAAGPPVVHAKHVDPLVAGELVATVDEGAQVVGGVVVTCLIDLR